MAVDIGVEPLTREQLVAVARGFETVTLSDAVVARLERQRAAIDALVESGTAGLRTVDRFWFAGDDVHLARGATRPAAIVDPIARRGRRARGRERGRARDDGLAPDEPLQRRLGRSTLDGRGVRRAAQRRHHADRPRVRLPRVLGRPRAAGPRGARPDGRG